VTLQNFSARHEGKTQKFTPQIFYKHSTRFLQCRN